MSSTARNLSGEKDSAEQFLVLSFSVDTPAGPITCGLNIHKVREVIEVDRLNALPREYAPFFAVHDLRGMPIPVLPLNSVFSRETGTAMPGKGRILVIELQGKVIGLLVSATGQIRRFRNADALPPPAALEGIKNRFFNGVVKDATGYIYLLDIESILDSFGLSLDRDGDASKEKALFAGKRVLIVEDSQLYQKKIRSIFSAWGCAIDSALNGQEALEILAKKNFAFDLVFTDIEMPVMNGIEFATRVKAMAEASHIPLIFNSSLSNPMLIEEIRTKGLGGYIVKFDQDSIRDEVTRSLAERS